MDTIFALATGGSRAAIAIVRIAGPKVREIAEAIAGRLPAPRVAALMRLRDPDSDETLDRALVLFFEAARSEIGEDSLEFHLHGSPAVVTAVLRVLGAISAVRQAEPGEFARRAFANGKMDLAQVEGLADLIDAETTWQRRQAQRQMSGAMRDATAPWRDALLRASALVETAIDFAEDVDLGDSVTTDITVLLAPVRAGLRAELAQGRAAERVRDGVRIVIAGPPNAGKSTLLNALARREAAIVSAIAGTTRDPIEVHLDLGGCPVTLIDTAGLRESADAIERIGVFRARERADAADLVLWLGDDEAPEFAAPLWRIAPKADLRHPDNVPPASLGTTMGAAISLSARTGENLDGLVDRLSTFARRLAATGADGLLVRARHRAAFEGALAALDHAIGGRTHPIELVAEDLRHARFALERLIGTVDVEDILGDIFSRFCIGK